MDRFLQMDFRCLGNIFGRPAQLKHERLRFRDTASATERIASAFLRDE